MSQSLSPLQGSSSLLPAPRMIAMPYPPSPYPRATSSGFASGVPVRVNVLPLNTPADQLHLNSTKAAPKSLLGRLFSPLVNGVKTVFNKVTTFAKNHPILTGAALLGGLFYLFRKPAPAQD